MKRQKKADLVFSAKATEKLEKLGKPNQPRPDDPVIKPVTEKPIQQFGIYRQAGYTQLAEKPQKIGDKPLRLVEVGEEHEIDYKVHEEELEEENNNGNDPNERED